jgi:hypothetical protein
MANIAPSVWPKGTRLGTVCLEYACQKPPWKNIN